MLAIVAAVVLGLALILDLANVGLGSTIDLVTFVIVGAAADGAAPGRRRLAPERPHRRLAHPPPFARLTQAFVSATTDATTACGISARLQRRALAAGRCATGEQRRGQAPRPSAHSPRSSRSGRTCVSSASTASPAGTARQVDRVHQPVVEPRPGRPPGGRPVQRVGGGGSVGRRAVAAVLTRARASAAISTTSSSSGHASATRISSVG